MICKKCGCEIKADSKFCYRCGEAMELAPPPPFPYPPPSPMPPPMPPPAPADLSGQFFDPAEKCVAVLGKSYLGSYLSSGDISSGMCVLSDKRVYFKGKCYDRSGGRLKRTVEESVVDVRNITASGFSISSIIVFFVLGIIFLIASISLLFSGTAIGEDGAFYCGSVFFISSLILFIIYACTQNKMFYIAFAGGKIAFKASNYSREELQEFQRALRLTIDARTRD